MKGEKKPLAPTKRWKRGQSCVSNPEYRKFRDAAKKKQSSGFQFSSKSNSLIYFIGDACTYLYISQHLA